MTEGWLKNVIYKEVSMNKKVYIFLADGFEDIEGLTVVDLMRRADIDIKTVSIKKSKEITTSHGITMLTDLTFAETDFTDADMLVLPGGMPGTKYLNEYQPLRDLLADFYKKGGKVAAICAAPTVLASLGFLEKRKATAYPSCMEGLAGAERSLESVVVDENFVFRGNALCPVMLLQPFRFPFREQVFKVQGSHVVIVGTFFLHVYTLEVCGVVDGRGVKVFCVEQRRLKMFHARHDQLGFGVVFLCLSLYVGFIVGEGGCGTEPFNGGFIVCFFHFSKFFSAEGDASLIRRLAEKSLSKR